MPFLAVLLIVVGLLFGISGLFDLIAGALKFAFYLIAILFLAGGIMMMFNKAKS
ncbi:hypothetical protein M3223_09685 [Paenibacillus pasadenensis]|uniref:hypothetical protein n=1 Tax=Paenibacillus pasadenensis TaxID=217090 RepID=UPI00203F47AC|nr:hypothetical protein [Paenibacillus pasadenensis]MCM3747628.1 hypothetical protein [Paenibacillus pasadenensis]